jgi:hypothetical protein
MELTLVSKLKRSYEFQKEKRPSLQTLVCCSVASYMYRKKDTLDGIGSPNRLKNNPKGSSKGKYCLNMLRTNLKALGTCVLRKYKSCI